MLKKINSLVIATPILLYGKLFVKKSKCDSDNTFIKQTHDSVQNILTKETTIKRIIDENYKLLNLFDENEQTEEICKYAITINPLSLRYVKNQTDEICKFAIEKDKYIFYFIKNQTDEICKFAIEKNPYIICFIKNQTDEICKFAIEKNPYIIHLLKNKTDKICKFALEKNPRVLNNNSLTIKLKFLNWFLKKMR